MILLMIINRYARQTILPEIGEKGQRKLLNAAVLCVGAGGLGCPALLYLSAAGIGRIGIIDPDIVEESNLQRQILYTTDHIGMHKAIAAKEHLARLNTDTEIEAIVQDLNAQNAQTLFSAYDIILDGTDNFASKFLINDAALKTGKPFIYASILGFEGQIAVFGLPEGPCYRCLFPHPPQDHIPTCAENGVIGALAGMLGTMQAMEAIKLIVGHQTFRSASGKVRIVDARTMETNTLTLPKTPDCPGCSKPPKEIIVRDERESCAMIPEISPEDMQRLEPKMLIDVRERHEWDAGFIMGAQHIPLSALLNGFVPDLPQDRDIVLYCEHGMRSRQAAQILHTRGYGNVLNLKGGYQAWLKSVR